MDENNIKSPEPTPKGLNELQEKLSLAEKERDEYLNGWKRAKADLINSKRDWEEKISALGEFVTADVIKKFLPVLDALEAGQDTSGLDEIKKLFSDILRQLGLEEIEVIGKKFDPVYHESVGEDEGPASEVIKVLQKGYFFKGQVIRPARVKIGK